MDEDEGCSDDSNAAYLVDVEQLSRSFDNLVQLGLNG